MLYVTHKLPIPTIHGTLQQQVLWGCGGGAMHHRSTKSTWLPRKRRKQQGGKEGWRTSRSPSMSCTCKQRCRQERSTSSKRDSALAASSLSTARPARMLGFLNFFLPPAPPETHAYSQFSVHGTCMYLVRASLLCIIVPIAAPAPWCWSNPRIE